MHSTKSEGAIALPGLRPSPWGRAPGCRASTDPPDQSGPRLLLTPSCVLWMYQVCAGPGVGGRGHCTTSCAWTPAGRPPLCPQPPCQTASPSPSPPGSRFGFCPSVLPSVHSFTRSVSPDSVPDSKGGTGDPAGNETDRGPGSAGLCRPGTDADHTSTGLSL